MEAQRCVREPSNTNDPKAFFLNFSLVFFFLYDQDMVESKELTIPHAQMHARNFVLVPSAQIAPNWIHPIFKLTLKELAKRSEDPLKVDLWRS